MLPSAALPDRTLTPYLPLLDAEVKAERASQCDADRKRGPRFIESFKLEFEDVGGAAAAK